MSELMRVLGRLQETERDEAILRILTEVLLPEWESALAARHEPDAAARIRAVQRVQNMLAIASPSFAPQRRESDHGRLHEHERALVARLLERCLACCRPPEAAAPKSGVGATTRPPPSIRTVG